VQAGLVQRFIRVDIAHACDDALIEQDGFETAFRAA
jgi:hypothetical protein